MTKNPLIARPLTIAAALGAAAIVGTLLASPAAAAPTESPAGVISLSWNGTDFTSVIGGSFVGVPVSVPGDTATRTLTVRNDGPSDGVLKASIVNVKILDPEATDAKGDEDQGNFYDDLRLNWNGGGSNFTTLAQSTETDIQSIRLARGAVTPITIGYEFPVDATSGNKANVAPREASFDVRLTISGDTQPTLPGTIEPTPPPTEGTGSPEPTPTLPGTIEPTPPPTDGNGSPEPTPTLSGTIEPTPTPTEGTATPIPTTTEPGNPPLVNTGANTLGAVALGLGLLGLGTFAAARARRKGKHSN